MVRQNVNKIQKITRDAKLIRFSARREKTTMNEYRKNILNFGAQLTPKAVTILNPATAKPDGVIICGMGGSALAGEMIKALKTELIIPVPVITWKNYGLPRTDLKKPLVIAVSFSGNTEETLSGFAAALKAGMPVAAVGGGGKLKELALKNGRMFATFEKNGLAPRQAVGLMFYGTAAILKRIFRDITVPDLSNSFNSDKLENKGKSLAKKLKNKIPVVCASPRNRHLAYDWKIRCNETAKIHAFSLPLPEMNHNELAAIGHRSGDFFFIFLQDNRDDARLRKRIAAARRLFRKRKIGSKTVEIGGKNFLERDFQAIALADWTAYYLALARKVNPKETPVIEEFKKIK
ncbi:MAG: bifunctional phosphoglucose/phosphomannose isomerase [Parcubacteria group bacterium]|nr:bifunctional phosphoglucose/phosphomannose isomerase [Parcubacteria group bacterium]